MRKVLVLSPCDVFPPVHGSSTAIYHTLQFLSQGSRVAAVLCYLYSQHGTVDLAGPNLRIEHLPPGPIDRLGYKGLAFNPGYYRLAARVMSEFQPDVIQAELLWTAPAALWLRRRWHRPVVLMQENVEYQKFVRFGQKSPLLRLVRWLEAWACRSADRVVALSEVDRDLMAELYGLDPAAMTIIPHGVDPELFDYRPDGAAAARAKLGVEPGALLLTFVGKLDYVPNVRAVGYIADQIAPAVWKRYPAARFAIIGQGQEAVARYARDGLLFTGFVDARPGSRPNLSDYLSASDVVLVPLDAGSGTRLKILEAAANARPILSTRIGAEGLGFADGREILLTDAVDEAFVERTLRLLDDAGLRETLRTAARQRVLDQYSWHAQVSKMQQVHEELCAGQPSQKNG
ncbi:MAG TPA: glycosyltransferase family 4 protein [Anaerolineae bacterium]|nr:glycosyltransferase family 4 protein [Anaerolineae bacterium]HNS50266.1 glycosyltransferase family 4 protein [Anaerolineae bacterium]